MQDPKQRTHFWLGNGLLGLALLTLFFLDTVATFIGGAGAMGLWMILAGVGMYFLMRDKGPTPGQPD